MAKTTAPTMSLQGFIRQVKRRRIITTSVSHTSASVGTARTNATTARGDVSDKERDGGRPDQSLPACRTMSTGQGE